MTNTAVLFRAAPKHRSEREFLSGEDRVTSAAHGIEPTHHEGRLAGLLGAIRAANAQGQPALLVGGAGVPFRTGTH